MQSVKITMRQIGVPNPQMDIISSEEFENHIEFNFTTNGYEVQDTHYLGAVVDGSGNAVGYKVLFVMVKNEEEKPAKAGK